MAGCIAYIEGDISETLWRGKFVHISHIFLCWVTYNVINSKSTHASDAYVPVTVLLLDSDDAVVRTGNDIDAIWIVKNTNEKLILIHTCGCGVTGFH